MTNWHIEGRDVFVQDWETREEMSVQEAEDKLNRFVQLEEIKAAARIIFEVSDKASFKGTSIECPHGNIPSYPTHAWWCDKCFLRLKNALEVSECDT